ncbi:hypothetical protein GN244_ATG15828 [Phytophthora infestans]|uniref:Uncharacterized protein n=1 Tax=Phytophthora infestans TaxID=4787 RepID=A0A833SLQ8_PHYIN|nr:hypothetical protein GN244_ATG15828 [Phytophthora infestans]
MGSNANIQAVSKPQVYVAPAGAVAAGDPFYVAHYLACISLSGLSGSIKKCPMQKNPKGSIYISYNSSATSITTGAAAGTVTATNIASINSNMNFGNTCPILWNGSSANTTNTDAATGLGSTNLLVTADVNGTATSGSGIGPSQMFSRLLVPTYSPNPSGDNALIQKKTFRYFERVTYKFTLQAALQFGTLQSSLVMICSYNEMIKSGVDGGLDDVTYAGLLSQRLWESLYRFIAVGIGRRLPSEDDAIKSIIVSGTNNTNYALTIYYHILREVVANVDTAMGTVSQGAVQN